ncbi:MAG TPA: pitrilysin family protein [Solirubrobacteraceae bacterium]|nr:pitrilysin family protein [Solirubrobacteraceae bacterium]
MSDEHRITTLESGVRVVTERVPSVRSVALGFWIGTGSVSEHDDEAGISHLLEHMLFRGTERYGSQEIDEIFDAMGAEINAGTDKEATSLYTRVLDRHLERAFEVMSEMVWQPRFGELEAEREVVLEEIAMYEDDPQDRVFDVLGRAIFGAHPLGRAVIGTAEVVGAVTREQLAAFHGERYQPGSIVIAAAGSIDHDALVRMAERHAPHLPGANGSHGIALDGSEQAAQGAVTLAVAAAPDFTPRAQFLQKDTEQYHVCVGGAGIARADERRYALRVLEGVLGGTSSSRLFQEIRERRGLAYSVFTFSNLYAHTGEVGLYVGTRPDNIREALAVVAAELERCVEDPASVDELVRSRENLKGRVVLGMESTGARMSRLGASVLNEMPILSVNEMLERIDSVEIAAVRELAGELFAPGGLSVAGVGPGEDVFISAIEPLGASAGAPR